MCSRYTVVFLLCSQVGVQKCSLSSPQQTSQSYTMSVQFLVEQPGGAPTNFSTNYQKPSHILKSTVLGLNQNRPCIKLTFSHCVKYFSTLHENTCLDHKLNNKYCQWIQVDGGTKNNLKYVLYYTQMHLHTYVCVYTYIFIYLKSVL